MNVYQELSPSITVIEDVLAAEGQAYSGAQLSLTGNMMFVRRQSAVWFEFTDEHGTLQWVTADMEEPLVVAGDREEARLW